MSALKGDECDDASAVDDSSSTKGRMRKSKKPEIQIYQPRPLREKLRSQSSDHSKSPHEVTSPRPQAARDIKGEPREQDVKKIVKPKSPDIPAQQDPPNQHYDSKDKSRGNRDAAKRGNRKKREMLIGQGNNPDEFMDMRHAKSPENTMVGVPEVSTTKIQGHSRNTESRSETKVQQKSFHKVGKQSSCYVDETKGQCSLENKEKSNGVKSQEDNYGDNSLRKDFEKGVTDSRNSEKKINQNKDRHYEKPQRKRKGGRNSSYQEEESLHSSLNDTFEVKSVEFYPSSMGKRDAEAFKSKSNTNSFKQRSELRAVEEKKPDRGRNERSNRRHDESLVEEQSGRSPKGSSQQYRGKKPQDFKGDYHGHDDDRPENKVKPKNLEIAELANKVEKVSLERSNSKEASSKKGVSKPESPNNYSGDSLIISNKTGWWKSENVGDDECDYPYKSSTDGKNVSDTVSQKQIDKANKAKSYSVARESRKNRSANKSAQNSEKQNIEVTVNRDGQGRTTQVKKDKLSRKDIENQRLPHKIKDPDDRNWEKEEIYSSSERFHSHSNVKAKLQPRVTCDSEVQDKGLIYLKDSYDEKDTVEPMNFIDIPDEDWDAEVDREMAWCNAREQGISGKAPTWEDEDLSWRHDKDEKRHGRQNAYSKRAESPGHRGGLIQLPTTFATAECISRAQTFSEHAEPAPLMQKHLYNPNNPSKPVLVVPSARDLPLSRDTQRESTKNFEDNGANNFSFQGHSGGGHIPDNHSPKVDPTILYNIQKGELDISYYVSSNQLPIEFRRIMDIRHHLQSCYKQLLMSDIRMCQEKNIEGALWKTLYYIIIEKLREYITREPNLKDRSLATLRMLVDEGQQYLQGLLDALQREYNFTLEDHLEEEGISNSGVRTRGIRIPLMSAQKLLLSLGDLARYKEHYTPAQNYALAKKWYHMALQVYPRNGRPFNQLAIIAANQKRPLDVVYYYIRSLTASNPFVSARDSLVSMFDDIRKKYIAGRGSEQHPEGVYAHEGRPSGGESLRQEIWIRPDSGATHRRTLSQSTDEDEKDKQDDLKKLPLDQLMKRFLTSYLHCHGMLFSRVGLDEFPKCCQSMLREFTVLLRTHPPRLSTNHLLQILAINMFAVKNTEAKETRVGSGYRAAAQELSLVLAHEMFGRLVQIVMELFPDHLQYQNNLHHTTSSSQLAQQQQQQEELEHLEMQQQPPDAADPERLFTPTLAHFLPPLKAWCDWLLYQFSVWNPPPDAHEYANKDSSSGGTWCSVAELATVMRGFGPPDLELSIVDSSVRSLPPGTVLVRLTEDAFLRGYEPLLQAHKTLYYVTDGEHMGRASDWARVMQLQKCLCQLLCGVDPPVLRLQKTDRGDVLVSVVDTSPPDSPTPRLSESSIEELDESMSESDTSDLDDDLEEESAEGDEENMPLAATVKLLTQRKKLLEKKHRQQRKLQSKLEGCVTLEMEVRPRYLVPDTNCFIEHLEVVLALAKNPSYTLMVPVVVLNELDGLSRDAAVAKYGSVGHAVRVREGAAAALHCLREEKPHSVKTVTSQGSVLSSTTFTAEIDVADATNDDKILSCCVHFCSDSTQRRPIKAGVRRLYREVVLLTEDRNLRVKAHARDVPVRNLLDFARWAGIR